MDDGVLLRVFPHTVLYVLNIDGFQILFSQGFYILPDVRFTSAWRFLTFLTSTESLIVALSNGFRWFSFLVNKHIKINFQLINVHLILFVNEQTKNEKQNNEKQPCDTVNVDLVCGSTRYLNS